MNMRKVGLISLCVAALAFSLSPAAAQSNRIQILYATYTGAGGGWDDRVVLSLQQQCAGTLPNGTCEFSCNNAVMGGDPAVGTTKVCHVVWRCGGANGTTYYDNWPESSARYSLYCD